MSNLTATERDARHLFRAIELAWEGRGRTSPNPLVGTVLVKDGRVIGEGAHLAAGEAHAERAALAVAAEDPRGATLYVTLEPCCHHGRTPPCTDAILEAGIARVVVASDDPTEKASGRGLGVLRDEGVAVDLLSDGDVGAAARLQNQPFRKHARSGRPLVVLKTAMTLDGKVATRTGDSHWISGEASRARAHRWRAEADAVVVGIGTALADDPQLTARVEAVHRQPRRVVFDSEARLPLTSALVRSAAETPVIVVSGVGAPRASVQGLESAGVDVISVTGQNEGARVAAALDELGRREVQSILLEGGSHLAGAFFDAQEIDEVRSFVAPIVTGGREAPPPIGGSGVEQIGAARRALHTEVERIEDDVLITARLREW
ncbi:MAG: bifunctional diaminohydroxyphosphoribosylaminopyrimidine deaminase/5-amino-6-(5-phosphoribosylamino)uracil reductase RibD [Thermoleophilaceae bacterium]